MAWSLGKKFSIFLMIIALLSSILAIGVLSQHLNIQAERAIQERAEILLTMMRSVRNYTRDNIQPALESRSNLEDDFIQETIPNFAARSTFADFRQSTPELEDFRRCIIEGGIRSRR